MPNTLLRAEGVPATETEMARLSFTEVGNGSTDTRAVRALRHKLDAAAPGTFDVRYERMDFDALCATPKPCIVSVHWSYFVSHMLPVMHADENTVILGDPLVGRRAVAAKEFKREWHKAGIYLTKQ